MDTSQLPAPPPDRTGRWLLLAICLLALVIAARAALRQEPAPVGSEAPALELAMLDGASLDLASLRGQVVLLDFWATWCPPCVESMPMVRRVGRSLADEGLVVVAVNGDAGPKRAERVRRFLERHGLGGLRVALDDGRAAAACGVTAYPTLVVVGRDGRIAATHRGMATEAELRALVAPALEAPPGVPG